MRPYNSILCQLFQEWDRGNEQCKEWKKAVEKNDRKLDEKLRAYIRMAERAWDDENGGYGVRYLEEMGGKERFTGADVKKLAGKLRERIAGLEDGEDKKN